MSRRRSAYVNAKNSSSSSSDSKASADVASKSASDPDRPGVRSARNYGYATTGGSGQLGEVARIAGENAIAISRHQNDRRVDRIGRFRRSEQDAGVPSSPRIDPLNVNRPQQLRKARLAPVGVTPHLADNHG